MDDLKFYSHLNSIIMMLEEKMRLECVLYVEHELEDAIKESLNRRKRP